MTVSNKGLIALAIVVIEISLWPVFLQVGGSKIGIFPELFYGFLAGSIISLFICVIRDGGKGLLSIIKKPEIFAIMLIAGLFNDAFTQIFLGVGTLGTNPSISSIIFRSWVIIVAFMTPFVLKQKVNAKQIAATLIGFLGIYVILSGGTLFTFNQGQVQFIGILFLATICSSISILIMNRYNVDTAGAIAIFNVISFITIAIIMMQTHTSINVPITTSTLFSILFLGIIAYGIGTMLYYYSAKSLGPLITGNVILAVPFMTILFSFLIVDTPIKTYYIIAAALTTIGILFQRKYSSLPERVTRKAALKSLQIFDVTSAFINNNNNSVATNIWGGNRAFALKLVSMDYDIPLHGAIFKKHNCVVFTNNIPLNGVKAEEIVNVNKLTKINPNSNEQILIGMGNPKDLEESFEEFVLLHL